MDTRPEKSFFRRFWWIFVILFILIIGILFSFQRVRNTVVGIYAELTLRSCPADLEGLLTFPFIEPEHIDGIIPLGNVNPPGHTAPVDHNYFDSNYSDKVMINTPTDGLIGNIDEISVDYGDGNFVPTGYSVQFTPCKGIVLIWAGPTQLSPNLKAVFYNSNPECKKETKINGEGFRERSCSAKINYQVKTGEEIGWVQRIERKDGRGYQFPFEIWATNYNKEPRGDVNWELYNDERYAHIMCTFDLYSGDLKKQYYDKLGLLEPQDDTRPTSKFTPRTVEPRCGEAFQDIPGTLQGFWFGSKSEDLGISFIHDNIDPTLGVIAIGGDFTNGQTGGMVFTPNHSGFVNREPSEIRADNNIYCYSSEKSNWRGSTPIMDGKILVQLLDDHHMKTEHQTGICGSNENFTDPFEYHR